MRNSVTVDTESIAFCLHSAKKRLRGDVVNRIQVNDIVPTTRVGSGSSDDMSGDRSPADAV